MSVCRPKSAGFSLMELAIVLSIIALVGGMSMSIGKTMLDVTEINGTRERLETIRDALLLFQKKHARYPCPALPADSSASATYGYEVSGGCDSACPAGLTCDNSAVIGAVPFKALKINEETAYDSWDAKITYAVDKNHTQSSTYNTGGILITDINGHEITFSPALGDAIFVLASHGKDSKGAYGKSGALIAACGATGEDVENCNGDDTFTDSRFILSDNPAGYYDDLIAWQTQQEVQTEESANVDFTFATGEHHTCAVKPDGTAACWGMGVNLRLGDGTGNDQLTGTPVVGLTNAVQISAADWVSHAVTSDGNAWGWGGGSFSPLGDGTANGYATPRLLFGNARQISSGKYHNCAVKNDDTGWCWGRGNNGEVGDGDTNDELSPVQILTNVNEIRAACVHSCAVKKDGTVWCWGYNGNGQLGDGTTTDRLTPVQVTGLTGATDISGGWYHVCALKSDGTVWCWGKNDDGQLGDGTTTSRSSPVMVSGLPDIIHIAAGEHQSCALKKNGTVWCWGNNWAGQLGDGTTTDSFTPVQVTGLTDVVAVDSGEGHVCAKKKDETLWCWGWNSMTGQLGDGTTTDRSLPTQVLNFP